MDTKGGGYVVAYKRAKMFYSIDNRLAMEKTNRSTKVSSSGKQFGIVCLTCAWFGKVYTN